MAVDKIVDGTALDNNLTSVANAIRTKGGTSGSLSFPSGFVSAINDLSGGGGASWTKVGSISGMQWTNTGTAQRPRYSYSGPTSVQLSENHTAGDIYFLVHTSGSGITDGYFKLTNKDFTATFVGFYSSDYSSSWSASFTGTAGSNTLAIANDIANGALTGVNADIYKLHLG